MRLANWNLERASTPVRRNALRMETEKIAADVWVFTEAHAEFSPGLPHACHSTAGRDGVPGLDQSADYWVSIYSNFPIVQLETRDPVRTCAARIYPDTGAPFLVFGTVLPWFGDKWRGHPSLGGVAFAEAVRMQLSDWVTLRRDHPDDEFFLMGDFNQDLALSHYYGSKKNRETLLKALDECGLVALTAGTGDPIRRDSPPYACIDHICARSDSLWQSKSAIRWPDSAKPTPHLSDHFGVAVEFKR